MADGNIRMVATATTPLEMVLLFMPIAIQLTAPEAAAHVRLLPAALSAGPAAKVTDPRTLVG